VGKYLWLFTLLLALTTYIPVHKNPRHSGLAPESRNNHHPPPNPRHSGLDPESSVHPFMDPGSMSPHELGDVRDDVCSISLRKGKWLYSNRLYKGSGARRSAETPNPRHSGLDPESSPYPVMDPGSKSPHRFGDVRDDVSLSLASSERREHGRQETLLSSMLVPRSTPAHRPSLSLCSPTGSINWITHAI